MISWQGEEVDGYFPPQELTRMRTLLPRCETSWEPMHAVANIPAAVISCAWTLAGVAGAISVVIAAVNQRKRSPAAVVSLGHVFGRTVNLAHLTTKLAVASFGIAVSIRVAVDLLDLPRSGLTAWDWLTALATVGALIIQLWDPKARFPLLGLYFVGFGIIGMLLVLRDLSPGTYFVWTGICELTGFVLVAALAGWAISRFPFFGKRLRVPNPPGRWSGNWFRISQAVLASTAVPLIVWIALDTRFDGMGESHALLGLAGRLASCPAALILLGGSIVMAWQTTGLWRAAWQFASMAAGVLFTTVIGWSRIESSSNSPWSQCCSNLMITTAMMTLLTRFGLARVLPNSGDWIERARRAAPVFAGIAALMFVMVLVLRCLA